MSLLSELGLSDRPMASRPSGPKFGAKAVGQSEDLARILALPARTPPTDAEQADMAESMTALLRRDNALCTCAEKGRACITRLFPIQGWFLWEAMHGRGALGFAAAGAGKTGISILLPMVVPGAKDCALLIPPALRAQFAVDYEAWSQHFKVPNLAGGTHFVPGRPSLNVIAYSALSRKACATWFQTHRPNVVIADEAQHLKDLGATVTNRFFRYLTEVKYPVSVYLYSGSMTTSSIGDYYHLSALALQENSPLPIDSATAKEWAGAIDPPRGKWGERVEPGALMGLCEPGETLEAGFCRRLTHTQGVITTADAAIPNVLRISARDPGPIPPELKALIAKARAGQRPDDQDLTEALERAVCVSQLTAGFYYFWRFPHGEPEALIAEWLAKRKAWNRELSERLEHRELWLDSPEFLEEAAKRYHDGYSGPLPVWRAATYPAWREIEKLVRPVESTEWLDDYLAADAVKWGSEKPGVIWYTHTAFGERVAELGGFPLYAGGKKASVEIARETGERTIVCQVKAHGTGKNLQMFSRALVANSFVEGWEQLLARHHRQHQRSHVVTFELYQHTPELRAAFKAAQKNAAYVQKTTGKKERLLFAEYESLDLAPDGL